MLNWLKFTKSKSALFQRRCVMLNRNRCAKINIKVLIILIIITAALGVSLFAARQIRRGILSKMALNEGNAAYEKEDWETAYKNFQEYLGRNPDDIEILRKYAKARISVRPIEGPNVMQAIVGYRRIMQLDPLDEDAYEQLTKLYSTINNFEELAYIARNRLADDPNDWKATLKLAEALYGMNKTKEAQEELRKLTEPNLPSENIPAEYIEEYVQACGLMSQIIYNDVTIIDKSKALKYLTQAVENAPESVMALASRARFYRVLSQRPSQSEQDVQKIMELARIDLEKADNLVTEDPRIRLLLAEEWIAHGELDLAEKELQAAESLPQETLEEHFLDIRGFTTARFVLALNLATRRGDATKGSSLADEALDELTEARYRVQILPLAIPLYVNTGKASEARDCLDEYVDILHTQQETADSRLRLAYLQALVARAEKKPYAVINALQPVVVSDVSNPMLIRLLVEAYVQTGQTGRAVGVLTKYLSSQPQDFEMIHQLAKEYTKLGDWSKALKATQMAESLNPTDVNIKLLRIGANIYVAAEQDQDIDKAKLEELSAELAKLRQENRDRIDIRTLQAMIAVYLGHLEETESELKLAIEQCAEPLRAEMQLVGHYQRTGRMDEAIELCQRACERHASVAQPWLSLSELHVANTDYDAARNCLKEGLNSVIDGEEEKKKSLSIRLALLELMQGDRTAGISILTELAAQDKQEIRARTLLLVTREMQENQNRARAQELIDELREAEGQTGLQWRLHQASLWLASDEWRTKQQDITSLLQYCIDADPQWSVPVLLMVNMYEKLNDFRHVEDICRQALVRNPAATEIAAKLVSTLERQGRLSDAEEVLKQTEADSRLTSALHIRTALQAGEFSRAIEELELRVKNDEKDASSRILLARLIYQQNKADVKQALAYLNQAEAITSGSLALTAARVSILKAEGQEEEARQILDNYVVDSNAFSAYMMRAVYLAEEGEHELAEQDYKKLTTFPEQGAIGYELLGNFYSGNKQLDKAIEALEEGLKAYPENLRLERRLMETLFLRNQAQDQQRAFEILATLQEKLPQDPELMKIEAIQILQTPTPQNLQTARQKLEDAIKLEPTAVDAHLVLIRIAMQEKRYEDARDSAIRALGSNPDNPALLSARSRAEFALNNTQLSAELAKLALQEDPNNTEARNVFVSAALKSEDRSLLEQARTIIESRLSSEPEDEQLLISRARIMAALESPQTAIPELEAYCRTQEGSRSVDAIVTLADLYRLSGDMDQAKLRIEQAEKVDPNGQTAILARLIWLVAQKQYEELEDISAAYISAKEQNLTTVLRAAFILTALDSMTLKKEGLKLYEHAVTLAPPSKDTRLSLASTLYQTGDVQRAKQVYQNVLDEYPNNVQALNDLAWILQEHDHSYEAALELANKGLINEPDELHLLDTRGTILSNMPNRLADAKRDFQRLVDLISTDAPRQAKSLLQLGRICLKLNDLDQAKQQLEKALEIDQKVNVFTPDERAEITRILQGS